MKEIEQSIFIDDEEEGFVVEVVLYDDGTSEQVIYDECGNRI